MQRTKPPFRADHVGSLLRSAALKDARAKRERGEITPEQLKAIEDREIEALITEAGGDRAQIDHRRREPPQVLADRFRLRRCRASRPITASARSRSRAACSRSRSSSAWRGKLGDFDGHPMIEHFKFLEGAHQGRRRR